MCRLTPPLTVLGPDWSIKTKAIKKFLKKMSESCHKLKKIDSGNVRRVALLLYLMRARVTFLLKNRRRTSTAQWIASTNTHIRYTHLTLSWDFFPNPMAPNKPDEALSSPKECRLDTRKDSCLARSCKGPLA